MRYRWIAIALVAPLACSSPMSNEPPPFASHYVLVRYDGHTLPDTVQVAGGAAELTGGELDFEAAETYGFGINVRSLTSDQKYGTYVDGVYVRIGADSVIFPAGSTAAPRSYGKRSGNDMVVYSEPGAVPILLPMTEHTWEFTVGPDAGHVSRIARATSH